LTEKVLDANGVSRHSLHENLARGESDLRDVLYSEAQMLSDARERERGEIIIEVCTAMNSRLLTESEVSERTQISLATLRRWRLENRGPKYHKFGSLVRYGEEELNRWEQTQPTGGESPTQSIPVKSVRSNILLRKSG
jgi:predicted DNA-binding transcriptional regulator AlpA